VLHGSPEILQLEIFAPQALVEFHEALRQSWGPAATVNPLDPPFESRNWGVYIVKRQSKTKTDFYFETAQLEF
jgi:hypothetical protein